MTATGIINEDAPSPLTLPVPATRGELRAESGEKQAEQQFADRHPVLHSIGLGLSAGLLALVLLLGVVTIIVPKIVGGVPLTVLSPSMEPTLPVGTMLVVRPVTPEEIRLGDIVTYMPNPLDPTLVTHRVVGITQHQDGAFVFTMQGDNNAEADDPVFGKQVRAVLMYSIPLLGYVSNWVNVEHTHWIIPVSAGALLAYGGYAMVRGGVEYKRKKDAERDPATVADQTPVRGALMALGD